MKTQPVTVSSSPTIGPLSKLSVRKSGSLSRIPELDGLRGIAILTVVIFHYVGTQLVNYTTTLGGAVYYVTSFGWVGVDLFFVLSGFLIGSILIIQKDSKNYFSTFYVRRLVRIVPNYFLMLGIFALIWSLPYFSSSYFLTQHNNIPLWSYFAMLHNFYMAARHSLGTDALSISWSIGIEEQFYLVFPFLVYFINKRWLPYLLMVLIVTAIIVRAQFDHWIPKYVLLPSRLDGLSMGFLLAYLNLKGVFTKYKQQLNKWLSVVLVADIAICAFFYWKYNDLGVFKHTLFSIIFSIMLIFALTRSNSWYGSFLRNRALMWVGTISYSLYLFHYMILGIAHHVITGRSKINIFDAQDILATLVAFIVSIAFSWLVYQKLEKPMVALGKRFRY